MAFQQFANGVGLLLMPIPDLPVADLGYSTAQTMDAVGEGFAAIGRVYLSTGPGTSKTFSSAGAKIGWRSGGSTFADAGSTVRVGIQDVGAAGLPDGAFDVYCDLVGGTDTITNVNLDAMTSGSKSITHGDLVAVVVEMTARGGADSVLTYRLADGSSSLPYIATLAAAVFTKAAFTPAVTLLFDDGTCGVFGASSWVWGLSSTASVHSGTTPDEYALIFRVPVPIRVHGYMARLGSLASTDDFELILYSDPLGTPVAIPGGTVVVDMSLASTGELHDTPLTTAIDLAADTDYALAVRPTTANAFIISTIVLGDGDLRKPTMLGTNWSQGSRTNQTGAFAQDETILPLLGLWIAAVDDGSRRYFLSGP